MSIGTKETQTESLIEFKGVKKKTTILFEGSMSHEADISVPEKTKIIRKKVHISTPPDFIKNMHKPTTHEKQYLYNFVEGVFAMIETRRRDLIETYTDDNILIDKLFWKEVDDYIVQTKAYIEDKQKNDAERPVTRFEVQSDCIRKLPTETDENK